MLIEEANNAPAEESKESAPAADKAEQPTVGDLLGSDDSKATEKTALEKAESAVVVEKQKRKDAERKLAELQRQIEDDADDEDDTDDEDEPAPTRSNKAQKVQEAAIQAAREEAAAILGPIQAKEREEKIKQIFSEQWSKLLDSHPEYKDVANKETIFALSLDPKNSNKTFEQIAEESYGHVVKGNRTLDEGSPSHSKGDDVEVDFDKAKKDPEYFAKVMANPATKKKYNENMMKGASKFF